MNKKSIYLVSCILMTVIFAVHETLLNLVPDLFALRNSLKFVLSSIPLILTILALKKSRNFENVIIVVALSLMLIGDITINWITMIAGVCFFFGHLCFVIDFVRYKKPAVYQYILWVVLSAAIILPLIFCPNIPSDIRTTWIMYTPIFTATAATSFCAPRTIRTGGILFAISDVLVLLNTIFDSEYGIYHIVSLGMYYFALMLIAEFVFLEKE